MDTARIQSKARELMRNHGKNLMIPYILWVILSLINSVFSGVVGYYAGQVTLYELAPELVTMKITASMVSAINLADLISQVFSVAVSIFAFFHTMAKLRFLSRYWKGETPSWREFFKKIYPNARAFFVHVAVRILHSLIVALGIIFLVIPGIYLALRYSMVEHVLAEDPTCGVLEAFRRSSRMMFNHMLTFLGLNLRFVGWYFLNIFTFGLLSIWLTPYHDLALVGFFHERLETAFPTRSATVSSAPTSAPEEDSPFEEFTEERPVEEVASDTTAGTSTSTTSTDDLLSSNDFSSLDDDPFA